MYFLRPALPPDAPFLAQVEQDLMQSHAHALWGSFAQPDFSGFDLSNTRIIEVDGAAAGYITIEIASDHLRLRKLYLIPPYQGRGIGRRLLAQAQSEADQRNLPLRLSVLRPNSRALAFYLREGMEIAETTADRVFLNGGSSLSQSQTQW